MDILSRHGCQLKEIQNKGTPKRSKRASRKDESEEDELDDSDKGDSDDNDEEVNMRRNKKQKAAALNANT